MKTIRIPASVVLMLLISGSVTGQVSELKAGDIISGTIVNPVGPFELANVRQYDPNGDFVDIAVTDTKGNFTMSVEDPNYRFYATAGSYYTVVDFVPTKEHMVIKLEPKERNMVPATDAGKAFINADVAYVSRQPVIPEEYICGYVVEPIEFSDKKPWYGLFLMKDKQGYMVVLRYADGNCSDTLRIDDNLADRLYGSLSLTIEKAEACVEMAPDDGITVFRLHEGSNVYAVMPGKSAIRWAGEIPDRVWNRLYRQFGKKLGYERQYNRVWQDYFVFGEDTIFNLRTYDDAYAVVSIVNDLRYRYDIETGEATVEYNINRMPDGNLVIESSVTTSGRTFPVTSIESGALDNCNALSSVFIPASVISIGELAFRYCDLDSVTISSTGPIACPVNAFDESVYEKAILNVPEGWNQKNAAQAGPAWGKFKNVRYR